MGVHGAALAIDGAMLLFRSNIGLCGQPIVEARAKGGDYSDSFFSFRDINDIDDYAKAALVKTWASSAHLSIGLLLKAINSSGITAAKSKACNQWLELLIPLLFGGLHDAIETFGKKSSSPKTIIWAEEVDAFEVACCCLEGLSTLAQPLNLCHVKEKWRQDIKSSTVEIYKHILLPALSKKKPVDTQGMNKLVAKSCELFKTFSTSISFGEASDYTPLLANLLKPLELLEKKEIDLSNNVVSKIIAACLSALAGIIGMPTSPSALVKAMLSLVVSLSTTKTEKVSESVSLATQELLQACLKHESASVAELSAITTELAKSRNWTAWLPIVKINDGIAAEESLLEVEKALLNPSSIDEQLEAMGAIRGLIQHTPPPNLLTGRILSAVGAEILSLFQEYGTLSNQAPELQSRKVAACADGMKIAMGSFQQFAANFSDEETTEFLIMLFEVFIAVLRFNGLPNHPPPQGSLSDPNIGRMCAQAITLVARSTPIPFKASMGGMSDHDRAVLEFAVRGEMSGYAVATAAAPVKKKLILKGFKKQ